MKRGNFLGITSAIVVIIIVTTIILTLDYPSNLQIEKIRPNIVVVMVDDLELGTLNYMLENGLMPNLQKSIIDKL